LIDAKGNLTLALSFLPDNVEDAKSSLREANMLLGEISQYLKQVAQELSPQRIRDYCENAYQYMERFREQFKGGVKRALMSTVFFKLRVTRMKMISWLDFKK
jgi:hypothetical protein